MQKICEEQSWAIIHQYERGAVHRVLVLTNQCLKKNEIWSKSRVMDPDSDFVL
jgi:hypothetical protein